MEKRKKPNDKKEPVKTRPPSRDKYQSLYLPKTLWAMLKELGDKEDRSVSYMAKRAVEEYLKRHGKEPGKKVDGGD